MIVQEFFSSDNQKYWIGFVYTFPKYRGHRYVGKLLEWCENAAASAGRENVYISTDHCGLYEKYGYHFLNEQTTIYGEKTRVYFKSILASSGEKTPL